MIKKFLIIIFISFSSAQFINSQSRISLSIGGGYLVDLIDNKKMNYWENGYSINLALEYAVMNNLSLFFNSSFQNHFFKASLFKSSLDGWGGYRYSADGEDRNLYEISIGGRFYKKYSFISPYLSLGAGILAVSEGKLFVTTWFVGGEDNKRTITSISEDFLLGQITVGLGSEINLTDNMKLVIEGKLFRTLSEGPSYVPIITSIKLGL